MSEVDALKSQSKKKYEYTYIRYIVYFLHIFCVICMINKISDAKGIFVKTKVE